jgi:hypothetical protein
VSGFCEHCNEILGSIPWLAEELLAPCRLYLLAVDFACAQILFSPHILYIIVSKGGAHGGIVFKALRYKPAGRRFDS